MKLYHGTNYNSAASIHLDGIDLTGRREFHLTHDVDIALQYGGVLVEFEIDGELDCKIAPIQHLDASQQIVQEGVEYRFNQVQVNKLYKQLHDSRVTDHNLLELIP